ncbi:MAG: hypothetical protein K8Q99_02375 [Acholeplasmataceae bacterium]|nr:hypothetical protein [Acholeplasmataceae bacterium]
MPSFLLIQWGIIGVFVFVHFLIGFLRGTRKSTYFTIVSLIMTVVTLFIVSKLSLNLIFKYGLSFESIINLVNGLTGGIIPADVITYLSEPQILGVATALIDLVIRIIGFIILYPILKFLLTLTIFKPIWKRIILPILLKKQNDKELMAYQEMNQTNKKLKPSKRLKKTILGRLGGGAIGSLRGLVVAFVFLVPLLVIAGFAAEVNTSVNVSQQNQQTQLSTDTEIASIIPSEIQEILDNIQEMNDGGLSAIVKDIKIQEKSLDRYIFDTVFTTQIVIDDVKTPINFGNELEQLVGIAGIAIQNGYLDDYDFNSFSSADIDNLEQVFIHIGQSDLIGYMIPAAVRYGVENLAPDYLDGLNLSERDGSQAALDVFYDIQWDQEFSRVFGIADAALTFASIGEWQTYIDQPELLAELTPEQGVLLANILRAFGDLEVLTLINVAVDYATTIEEAQQAVTWMDPSEVEGYLQEKFAFILDDPEFFLGSDGEIYRFANIIDTVFSDEFGDNNLTTLLNSLDDPQALIENQNPEWIGSIIDSLTDIQLFMEAIPIGVDYAFYTQLKDSLDATLTDQISAELELIEWDDEITNISDIYTEALKLGVGAVFGDDPNYYTLIDNVAVDHMDSLRAIVEYIFEGSDVVNVAIELASPILVDKYVTDEALKEVILGVLISDPVADVVDFSFGQELNNVLSIVESVFKFTTASELASISSLETNDLLELISQLGTLTDTEYLELRDAIDDLQILSRAGQSGLEYIETITDIPYLYVPDTVELNHDIAVLIDIAYEVANYLDTQSASYLDYQSIDFTDLLSDSDFTDLFLATDNNRHSDLIFLNIAYNLKNFSETGSTIDYISIPASLTNADIDSEIWEDEINAVLGFVFDLATTLGETPDIELSVKGIIEAKNSPTSLAIEAFSQFSDLATADAAFGSLDSSVVLRDSIAKTIDTLGASLGDTLFGYELKVPDHLLDDGMLVEGTLTDLIYSIAVLVEDINQTQDIGTIQDMLDYAANTGYLNAILGVSDNSIETLIGADLIHGILSDALLDNNLQASLVDLLNNAQTIVVFPDDILAVDPLLMDGDVIRATEISNILLSLRYLGITDTASFSTLGIATFTNLLGSNPDIVTGEDDFDRVFKANYIYTLLDKILKLDELGDYVGTMLGDALGISVTTFTTAPSAAMLADDSALYEPIEEGKIPKAEFRAIINSLSLLGDLGSLGLNTFTDMIEPDQPTDDFTTFIDSDFIYTILARLFEDPAFGDYVGDMLAGAFGDDPITLDMATPDDALGLTGVEEDLMTRIELRQLMVSFDMLGLDSGTDISITTIMDMIDQNIDPAGDDDFSRFINSIFIQDKVSQLLLSEQIIELIANSRFDFVDFVMPQDSLVTVGTRDRMIKQEIYDLFYGLKLVGLTDFENADISLDSITALNEPDQDQLLISSYLYVTLDLMLKSEASLTIPTDALEVAGNYDGMVKKDEIKDLLAAFNILGDSDPASINVNDVTIADLEDMLDLESNIIDQLVSDTIGDNLTTIPATAYNLLGTRITRAELYKMVETLLVLAGGDANQTLSTLMPIDTATITSVMLQDIHDIDSRIVDRITSEAIIDSGISIHSLAYDPLSEDDGLGQKLDIQRSELNNLIQALEILDIDISSANAVDQTKYTPANIGLLLDLESLIVYRLISEGIIDQNLQTDESLAEDVVDINYDPLAIGSDLKVEEMEALVEAMTVLGITNLTSPIDVSAVSVADLEETHYLGLGTDPSGDVYESRIIHRLISDAMDDSVVVPADGYMSIAMLDMKADEVSALIEALYIMGVANLTDPININNLTISELKDINYLGYGVDPVDEQYDSLTIHRLISDAIVDQLYAGDPLNAPSGVFMTLANEDLLANEVSAVIESLDAMGLATLGDPIDVEELTIVQLQNIHYLGLGTDPVVDDFESLILHRLISDSIVDSLYAGNPASAPDGVFMTVANEDLLATEISALIEALTEMGLTKLSDPIDVDNLSIAQLRNIHYLGRGIDPVDEKYQSIILHKLISESVISAVTIPNDAYRTAAQEFVKADEISALIEALDEMGLAKLSDPINVDDLSIAQLRNIHYLGLGTDPVDDVYESLVIHRLISDAVVTSLYAGNPASAPNGVFMTLANEDLLATEISALIESLDVMGLTKLSDPIDVDDLSVVQLRNVHYLGLGTDPGTDVYESLILHRLISDAVIATVTIPDGAYMTIAQEDVEADEISALIEALSEMGLSKLSDPIDVNALSVATLKELHYLGLGTDPATDVYESLIIHRMVSDAVVDSLYAGNPASAPNGVFMTVANEDLLADEVSALIASMEEMGIVSLGASLSFANPTKDQLQALHYLGLAVDPGTDLYQSYIVHRLISDSVVGALTVPDDAYMTVAQEDVKVDEISALIEAMGVMGITNLTAGFSFSNPTSAQIQELNYLGLGVDPVLDVYDSYIVHRLLSDAIDAAISVPSGSFIVGRPLDIKAEEIDHLIDTMDILGVADVTDFASVSTAHISSLNGGDGLTAQDVEDITESLTDGPNLIVYYFMSNLLDPGNDLTPDLDPLNDEASDANYVMSGPTRLRLTRSALAAALSLL